MSKLSLNQDLLDFSLNLSALDSRIDRCKIHSAETIVFISLSAVLCGAQSWNDIEDFGHSKKSFFQEHLPGFNRVPSHDTIARFFALINPCKFEECFRSWIHSCMGDYKGSIAIDGKTIRGASRKAFGKLHIISAYATELGLSLGQVKTDEKSNEITAIPQILDSLDIEGCTITIDAMGCQKDIAKKIIEKKGNYILIVKQNQKKLYQAVKGLSHECEIKPRITRNEIYETVDRKHGRVEFRTCYTSGDPTCLGIIKEQWAGIQTVGCVQTERYVKGKGIPKKEKRYFISSLDKNAKTILETIRGHWGIENGLHWQLDVNFKEDMTRKKKNAMQNFSTLCKMALAILKADKKKAPINRKRNIAGWDEKYLRELLINDL